MSAFGRFLPVKATQCAGQIRCKRLVKSNANGWLSPGNYAVGQPLIDLERNQAPLMMH